MPQIGYADMHCDSLTACLKAGGELADFGGQAGLSALLKAGCAVQCFAIFTRGENARRDFGCAVEFYFECLERYGELLSPVFCYDDIVRAQKRRKIAGVLTVENLGFVEREEQIYNLSGMGVKMASLVWNEPNAYAFPNFPAESGKGLTEKGKSAVQILNAAKIILDVSHLSDGGVDDVLSVSRAPVAASHSNCRAVHDCPRNLTDAQIKKIADGGGVVGVNLYGKFLGGGDVTDAAVRHVKHIVGVGGEDCAAIGGDLDGFFQENTDCFTVRGLVDRLQNIYPPRVAEKIAHGNFLRVFKDVVG